MPLTFIDIEKQKTWRIGVFFLILLCLYFCVTLALVQGVLLLIFPFQFLKTGLFLFTANPLYLLVVFGFALVISAIHFGISSLTAVENIMDGLGAVPPDPEDGIHRRLMNIIDEIHVVTGKTRKIQSMVIPSLSMNALAAADLKGNAVIAITEGLLSRLSRSQTEAVLAHEAYHIISGDCMEATVATSLFGMYAAALEKMQDFGDEDRPGIHPFFLLFWILLKFSQMLNMLISREREYRADAASVRMTRNPLSLAEALHLISRNWTGSGLIGSGLEMLCIYDPRGVLAVGDEGFWGTLMSTHPPIKERIGVLLRMAHVDETELDKEPVGERAPLVGSEGIQPEYYVYNPAKRWQGPFMIEDLATLPWFSPQSWISAGPGQAVIRASDNPLTNAFLAGRLSPSANSLSPYACPLCKQTLLQIPYEKTKVYECSYCRGVLVDDARLPRIIARRERECTERIKSLASALEKDNQNKLIMKKRKTKRERIEPLVACPKCHSPMLRTFYSLAYLVEIDRCYYCNLTWFDADELEILQCLIENRMTARLDLGY